MMSGRSSSEPTVASVKSVKCLIARTSPGEVYSTRHVADFGSASTMRLIWSSCLSEPTVKK